MCLFAVLFFGTIFGWITGTYFERIMLLWEKRVTANIIAENVRSHFDIGTFSTPKMGMDYENLSGELEHIILGAGIERIKVWNREMVITWADDRRLVGKQFSDNDELSKALDGQIMSEITETKHAENELEKQFTVLHELYVPIKSGDSGNIETVFEIYQNLDSFYADIMGHKKIIWTATIIGFSFLYIILFGIVWGASRRIDYQTEEIAESEKKYRTLIESAQDGIVSIDSDGKIVLANEAAAQMFGCTDDLVGQSITTFMPEEYRERHLAASNPSFKTGKMNLMGKTVEVEGLRENGQTFPLELSLSANRNDNAPIVTAMLRDISERKAMLEQLIAAEKQASVALIAGSIGHELNNVTSGLLGYADLLKMDPGDEKLAGKSADIFSTQSHRLKLYANNLLSISKPRKLDIASIDLNSFLDGITDMLSVSGILKNYSIVKQYAARLGPVVGDEALLEQVIRNLEINAAHAMGNGGILTIGTRASVDRSYVEFSIADTGHGIDKDKKDQIFDPFYTTKGEGKGTGLGMYIVKQTVEKHKGYIGSSIFGEQFYRI